MGYLINAAPAIIDSKKITISMWSKLLSGQGDIAGGYFNLFLCGPTVSSSTIPFEFWLTQSTTTEKFLMGYDFTSSGVGDFSGPQLIQAINSPPTTYDTGKPTSYISQYEVDEWNHIILAIDNSEAADAVQKGSTTTFYRHTARLRVNNVNIPLDVLDYSAAPGSGSLDSDMTYSAELILSGGQCYIPGPSIGGEGDPYLFGNQRMQIAHVNVFVGTYIDPDNEANMNNLIETVGDTITPKSAADVISAFGTPSIQLYGGAASIANNHGPAGNFTKVGTVTDVGGP